MDANQPSDVRQISISFRAESVDESSAWGRAGLIALEQAEADLEADGVSMSVERATAEGSNGTRGFADALIVSIVADAITTLLFRAATDLILRWQRMRPHRAPGVQPGGGGNGCDIILHAGNSQMVIASDTPDDKIYQQLALWTPYVLEAGNVTFEVANGEA